MAMRKAENLMAGYLEFKLGSYYFLGWYLMNSSGNSCFKVAPRCRAKAIAVNFGAAAITESLTPARRLAASSIFHLPTKGLAAYEVGANKSVSPAAEGAFNLMLGHLN